MKRVNRKLTREERVKKLYKIDKIELGIGKIILNLLGALLGTGLVLGFFWVIGMIMNWAESSTFNMIMFFLVTGTIAIKLWSREFSE